MSKTFDAIIVGPGPAETENKRLIRAPHDPVTTMQLVLHLVVACAPARLSDLNASGISACSVLLRSLQSRQEAVP